jgi:hypothetical protein
MDEVLHAERVGLDRGKVTFPARLADIPSGTFVRYAAEGSDPRPHLVVGNHLLAWQPEGYTGAVFVSDAIQELDVLTPRSIVAVLSAGYRPMLHPSVVALLAVDARTGDTAR